MKKQLFSIVMMLALVIVTGTAMAQKNTTPFKGGTYSYTLGGIVVKNPSKASFSYNGAGTVNLPSTMNVATTDNSITFSVTYGSDAGVGDLKVTILDETTTCSNFINLTITPANAPTLALKVTTTDPPCQNLNSNPENNKAADIGAAINSITFIVNPTFSTGAVAGGATYDYTFNLDDFTFAGVNPISFQRTAGTGVDNDANAYVTTAINVTAATDAQTIIVHYATTTGQDPEIITGTITNCKLHPGGTASNTYDATYTVATDDHAAATVKSTPAIGSFVSE